MSSKERLSHSKNHDMMNITKNGGYLMTEGALSDVIIHKNSLLGKYAGNYNVFNMKKIREFLIVN